MGRRNPEGTRLISRGDQGPDPYTYGTIKYEPFLASPRRCLCTKRDTILVCSVLVAALVIISVTLSLGLPRIAVNKARYLDTSSPVSPSPLLTFPKAVVITDAALCATIGRETLQKGGSAVDSAIATLFCNGVMNPQSMGIGGGFLMTVYSKSSQSSYVVDAREVAPGKASKDMFDGNASLAVEVKTVKPSLNYFSCV